MSIAGYIPQTYDLVPGEPIAHTWKSTRYEAPDGRTFWVPNKFIRFVTFKNEPGKSYGATSPDYMPADMIAGLNHGYRKTGTVRYDKRTLRKWIS